MLLYMKRSPHDIFNEAETKMNQLTLEGKTRFFLALDLYKQAGLGFKNAHNFQRAGDAYRRAVDCSFHLNNQNEAAANAAEAARLYLKSPATQKKAEEALNVAVKFLCNNDNFMESGKLLTEFAQTYENSRKYDQAVNALKWASKIYYENNLEFDSTRVDRQIGQILVSQQKWAEAGTHYTEFALKLSKGGTTIEPCDLAGKAVMCTLLATGPLQGRELVGKFNTNVSGWTTSNDYKLVNDVIDATISHLESKIQKAVQDYRNEKQNDKIMADILIRSVDILKTKHV